VRVVAGTARGRRLTAPPGTATRPTSDRVRESIFNALGSLAAVEGASVIDLFAGSGALGIEALSRGAARATFVDADRAALACIDHNLHVTGLVSQAEVVRSDVRAYLERSNAQFDLALIDPPYAFDAWDELLLDLPADLAVVESDRAVEPPSGWHVVREKRYGSTVVTVIRRTARPNGEQSE
jgi:16S rRNA (guanine966-N2)-methyltransferase